MRLQKKIIILIALIIAVFIGVSYSQSKRIQSMLINLFKSEVNQEKINFDKLLELKGKALETIAYDYTYWDEMVAFLNSGDSAWGKDILDTSLDSYDINAIWIYKKDLSLRYSVLNTEYHQLLREFPLSKEILNRLFEKDNFCHFFISTEQGLFEIRGATIHPGSDVARKTQPQGYFFAGRLWDSYYIHELSQLTQGDIQLYSIVENMPSAEIGDYAEGVTDFSRLLPGWNSQPVMNMRIHLISPSVREINRWLVIYFFQFIMLAGFVMILLLLKLTSWVGVPLYSISMALRQRNPKYLDKINDNKTEFGDINRLIRDFFKQKDALDKAMASVKQLSGLLPICCVCKKIRNDKGYWSQIEDYVHAHSEAEFSHGICPDCAHTMYPPKSNPA